MVRVSREKLSFIMDCTGSPMANRVCILGRISSLEFKDTVPVKAKVGLPHRWWNVVIHISTLILVFIVRLFCLEQMERAEHFLQQQVFLVLRWSLGLAFLCGSYCLGSVRQTKSEYQHFWTVFVPNSKMDNIVKSRERKCWRGNSCTSDYKTGYERALLTARNIQSERDRVVNVLRKLSTESARGMQYGGQKDRRRDRGPKWSKQNVTSTHENLDGNCTKPSASS